MITRKLCEHDYKNLMSMLFRQLRKMIQEDYPEEEWDQMEIYDQMIFDIKSEVWEEKTWKEHIGE